MTAEQELSDLLSMSMQDPSDPIEFDPATILAIMQFINIAIEKLKECGYLESPPIIRRAKRGSWFDHWRLQRMAKKSMDRDKYKKLKAARISKAAFDVVLKPENEPILQRALAEHR